MTARQRRSRPSRLPWADRRRVATETFDVEGTDVDSVIGSDFHAQLRDDIELLDGASDEFDQELVSAGKLISGILRFRSDQLRCRDIPGAFPKYDDFSASEKGNDTA